MKPYDEGHKAARMGWPIARCPHEPHTERAQRWREGWHNYSDLANEIIHDIEQRDAKLLRRTKP